MRKFLILAMLGMAGAFAGAVNGCDSAEAAFDCHEVCGRYHDCYDSSYDVGACEDRCRSKAANDPDVQTAADTCESCIGDKSCLSATFNCAGSCGAIVP